MFNDFNKIMSIIVVCQIASGYLLFSLVNSGLIIISMYSSVFVMACMKKREVNQFFLRKTEGVIIKTGYIH